MVVVVSLGCWGRGWGDGEVPLWMKDCIGNDAIDAVCYLWSEDKCSSIDAEDELGAPTRNSFRCPLGGEWKE